MIKPTALPKTNWKYPNSPLPTAPGTEINVTPERAVPIIPKATRYHFEFLFAIKKVELSDEFLEVANAIMIRSRKYPTRNDKSIAGLIV